MSSTDSGPDAPGAASAPPPPPQGAPPPPPPAYAAPPPGYAAPPPGYAAPPPGYGPPVQGKRPAIALVALLLSWIFVVGLILALIARAKVKRENTLGKGMTTAALIISLLFTGGEVAAIVVGVSTTNLHNTNQLAAAVTNAVNDTPAWVHGNTPVQSTSCAQQANSTNNYTCQVTGSNSSVYTITVNLNDNFGGGIQCSWDDSGSLVAQGKGVANCPSSPPA